MKAICSQCGTDLSDGTALCAKCGSRSSSERGEVQSVTAALDEGKPRKLKWLLLGSCVLLFAAVLVIVFARMYRSNVHVGAGAFPSNSSVQSPGAQRPIDLNALADAGRLLNEFGTHPESAMFSAEVTADSIGNTPAALYAWVRGHVRTEIYSGVLRGARGTLISGAGNSYDQALLLAAMLRHQGKQVRFARVQLTPPMATKVVDRMFGDAGQHPQAGRPVAIPDSLQRGGRATLGGIQSDWQSTSSDLLHAVDGSNIALGSAVLSEQALASEAADHAFVEYQDGDRWIPLDPILEDSPGVSISPAAENSGEIADSHYHHVSLHVWIEERHGRTLQQHEILRFDTTAAMLSGTQVLLSHKFDQLVGGAWRARPVLVLDSHAYAAQAFSAAGFIDEKGNSNQDLMAQAQQSLSQVGQMTDAFGDGKKPATKPAAAPQTELTAEWLEVEFTDPVKHSETVRRELIDRIGPVARGRKDAAEAPLTPITVAKDIPVQLSGIYSLAFGTGPIFASLPARRLASVVSVLGELQALRNARATQNGSLSPEDQARLARVLGIFPNLLQASAETALALSGHFAQRVSAGDSNLLFYEATPRLVIASFDPTSGLALDLRRDGLRAVGRRVSAAELARANLTRSAADAAIEGDLMRSGSKRTCAVAIFNDARKDGVRLVPLPFGAFPGSVHAPDVAQARVAGAAAGTLLIAPERFSASLVHFAWWQVDPSTGSAVSTLDTGLNGYQSLPEFTIIEGSPISPLATTLTDFNAVSPLATTLTNGAVPVANEISPLAYEVAAPWAQCGEFTGEMILELLRALTAAGVDTSQLFL